MPAKWRPSRVEAVLEILLFLVGLPVRGGSGGIGAGGGAAGAGPVQVLLMPPSLNDWLSEHHLARFVAESVRRRLLACRRIHASYTEVRGLPPHDPRLVVRLLIYGYTIGVRCARRGRSSVDVSMMSCFGSWPLTSSRPAGRSPVPSRRHRHGLFVQSLLLAQRFGHGQGGAGRSGRDEAARERLQAQGDEPRAPGRQGGAGGKASTGYRTLRVSGLEMPTPPLESYTRTVKV